MTTTEGRRGGGADPHPTTTIRGAGETHVGHVRDANQDVIVLEPELGLYAVLDGMGGQAAGDVAARLAADVTVDEVRQEAQLRHEPPRKVLEHALRIASAVVFAAGERLEQYRDMGTTAVACLVVDPTRVVIAHVGDSRAYLVRDGKLLQLTRDHTVAQELIDEGRLTARAARNTRAAHVLTRSLGGEGRPDVVEQPLEPGDRLLLCSDGLHGYTAERLIRRVLARDGAPEPIARELIALALRGTAPDNVSAVVISVDGGRAARRCSPRARA